MVTILLGFILIGLPFFVSKGGFIAWFYGWPILILGFFILFNTKEDNIEKRKDKFRLQKKNKEVKNE